MTTNIDANTKSITITIRLFAIFRDYFADQAEIVLQLPIHSTLKTVREALTKKMASAMKKNKRQGKPEDIVRSAAFALLSTATGEMEILTDDDCTFNKNSRLDVLPPVCGG